jgi:hypothetical protein
MKYILILLCLAGCASTPVKPEMPPVLPCPPAKEQSTCSDQIMMLDADALAKGYNCPNDSRLVFPAVYLRSEKVLVMCQCK